jgi:hypothetical protein
MERILITICSNNTQIAQIMALRMHTKKEHADILKMVCVTGEMHVDSNIPSRLIKIQELRNVIGDLAAYFSCRKGATSFTQVQNHKNHTDTEHSQARRNADINLSAGIHSVRSSIQTRFFSLPQK